MTRRKRRPRVEEDQTFSTQKRQKKESIETKQIEKAEQDIEPDQTFKEGIYIPREILAYIASFFDYRESLTLCLVNKAFFEIVGDENVWKQRCDVRNWDRPNNMKKFPYRIIFFMKMKTHCLECGKKTSIYLKNWKMKLCQTCRAKLSMNKTTAKATYLLNDRDLEKLPMEIKYTRWGGRSYLFLKSDLARASLKKYGGLSGVRQETEKRRRRREKNLESRNSKREKRRQELEEALQKIGIKEPSKYEEETVMKYINGTRDALSLDQLVQHLKRQNEIETKTAFCDLYEKKKDVLERIRLRIHQEYYMAGGFIRQYYDTIEKESLQEYKRYIEKLAIEWSNHPELSCDEVSSRITIETDVNYDEEGNVEELVDDVDENDES